VKNADRLSVPILRTLRTIGVYGIKTWRAYAKSLPYSIELNLMWPTLIQINWGGGGRGWLSQCWHFLHKGRSIFH